MNPAYQIAVLARPADQRVKNLRTTLARKCRDLRIPPSALRFLDQRSIDDLDHTLPVAALFFGGPLAVAGVETALAVLRGMDAPILPVVPDRENFSRQVPPQIASVNGYVPTHGDEKLEGLANLVLRDLGLVRRERMAFISYKRSESRRAALQLYHLLDEHSWHVFLDTHSVEPGSEFQNVLWDRISNADLLVFLDSPGAVTSGFVMGELARANQIGMGILQVVWPPPHRRTRGTELCEQIVLSDRDVTSGPDPKLRRKILDEILVSVERIRAKALAARKDRLTRAFCDSARRLGMSYEVESEGEVRLDSTRRRYRVIPVVGHPTSQHIHTAVVRPASQGESPLLLYDACGMLKDRFDHLAWLNEHLPAQTLAVENRAGWLRSA